MKRTESAREITREGERWRYGAGKVLTNQGVILDCANFATVRKNHIARRRIIIM